MIRIEIKTGNAAFEGPLLGVEAGRILHDLADRLQSPEYPPAPGYGDRIPLYDVNVNKVGTYRYVPE